MINTIKNLTIRRYWRLKILWDYKKSFLFESGWIQSYKQKKIIDNAGNDIPWISNAAFKILEEKQLHDLSIFEYGAGASTKYFSKTGCKVVSVDNDKKWYNHLIKLSLKNVTLIYKTLEDGYVNCIDDHRVKFDIIVIDGRLRVQCFEKAIHNIKEDGIIILDDSHRTKYSEVYSIANTNSLKALNLWGFGNGTIEYKCTTIFYNQDNCINL